MQQDTKQLVLFFTLTIPLSLIFWIPLYFQNHGILILPFPPIVFSSLGSLSPMLSLLILEKLYYRKTQPPKLFDQILHTASAKKKDIVWLFISGVIFPILTVLSGLLNFVFGLQPELKIITTGPDELGLALIAIIPVTFFPFLLTSPLFEEPAWRGFALTRLDKHMHWILSDIIVGTYWFLWHIGMDLAFDLYPSIFSFIGIMGVSFLIGAIFRKSGSNVLTAMFLHSGSFIMLTYFYSMPGNWILPLLEFICTALIHISRLREKKQEK